MPEWLDILKAWPGWETSQVTDEVLDDMAESMQSGTVGVYGEDLDVNADAAILLALEELVANGGGMLFFPAGTYRITSTITLPAKVSMVGEGRSTTSATAATLINCAVPGGTAVLLDGDACSVENMYLADVGATYVGIQVKGSRCLIRDVTVSHFESHGITVDSTDLTNCNCFGIEDTRVTNCIGNGIHLVGSDSNAGFISRCDLSINTGYGLYNDAADTTTIATHFSTNTAGAVYDIGGSNRYYSIYVEDSANFEVGVGSSYGILDIGFHGAPTVTGNAAALTSWRIYERDGWRRDIRLHDLNGPDTGVTYMFDNGVYGTGVLRCGIDGLGTAWTITSTLSRMQLNIPLNMIEITPPSAPPANSVSLYADDASTVTRLMARFPTGGAQELARQTGLVGDGVTNDRVALNAYIAACTAAGIPAYLGPGTYRVSGAHVIASGRIIGAGRDLTTIVQADTNQSVMIFDSKSNWELSDLTLQSNPARTNHRALQVWGEGEGGAVHRVTFRYGGLYVLGGDADYNPAGTTPGTQRRMVLDSVWSYSAGEYGISLADVQGVDLIAPQITGAGIDGVKFFDHCNDVTLTGGFATLCGQEGLDTFMGGYRQTITGFKAFDNTGNGITVKSDDNLLDAGNIQPQGLVTLVGVVCRDNTGSGITIDRNGSVDDPLIPLMAHVSLLGGVFENNGSYGIKVRARNVSIVGPLVRRNAQHGIYVDAAAMDCEITSAQVQANSQSSAGTYDGIHLNGTRNKVIGGSSIGQDDDDIANDGDYTGLTEYQRYGAIIINGSTGCAVYDMTAFGNVTGDVVTADADGELRIPFNVTGADLPDYITTLNALGTKWLQLPAGIFVLTETLVLPQYFTLQGQGRSATRLDRGFDGGSMIEMSQGSCLLDLGLDGHADEASRTGRGLWFPDDHAEQYVRNVHIIDTDGPCIEFDYDGGSRSHFDRVTAMRYNSASGTGRYAVVIHPDDQLVSRNKHFVMFDSEGNCAFDFGGSNNTQVVASSVGDLLFRTVSRGVNISSTRWMLQTAGATVAGFNNTITGCAINPTLTIDAAAEYITIMGNGSMSQPVVDNAAATTGKNQISHGIMQYTPVLSAAGGAPVIGNGTITGFYVRGPGTVTGGIQLTSGSTTNFGTGELRFNMPTDRASFGTVVGSCRMIDGVNTHTAEIEAVTGSPGYFRLIRDTSGVITGTSPRTWGTATTFVIGFTYFV